MNYLKHISLLSLLSFGLVGCLSLGTYDYNPPEAKHIYNYAGNWSGSLTEQATNPRSAEVSVTILGHNFSDATNTPNSDWNSYNYNLNGTWSSIFSSELSAVGIFQGSADAYTTDFTAYLTFGDDPNCSITINATRLGNSITGTYQPNQYDNSGCAFSDIKVGTFQISKQ